jgi:phospholipid N-methyltransferase
MNENSRNFGTAVIMNSARPALSDMQKQGYRKPRGKVLPHVILFVKNFLKYPTMQGSLVPSSQFLINGMLRQVDWQKARVLVEFGPGVGNVTQEILRRMHPDAILVAIELNPVFVELLRDEIRDPRLRVVHGSAAEVHKILADLQLSAADYIISSLPYTNMGQSIRKQIMLESRRVLSPEGSLVFFQYTTAIVPMLRSSFGSIRREFLLLNFPPALIFNCTP